MPDPSPSQVDGRVVARRGEQDAAVVIDGRSFSLAEAYRFAKAIEAAVEDATPPYCICMVERRPCPVHAVKAGRR